MSAWLGFAAAALLSVERIAYVLIWREPAAFKRWSMRGAWAGTGGPVELLVVLFAAVRPPSVCGHGHRNLGLLLPDAVPGTRLDRAAAARKCLLHPGRAPRARSGSRRRVEPPVGIDVNPGLDPEGDLHANPPLELRSPAVTRGVRPEPRSRCGTASARYRRCSRSACLHRRPVLLAAHQRLP